MGGGGERERERERERVKNFGVTLDSNLIMTQHISSMCEAAYIKQHVRSLIHTNQAYQFHTTPSHYSSNPNPCLLSCPLSVRLLQLSTFRLTSLLVKLQKVQNAAARLVCKVRKSDHIHPIFQTLHWLPVTHHIEVKISAVCFSSISITTPQFLFDLLQPYTPTRQLRSASDPHLCYPSCEHKTFSARSFSYAGSTVWNSLPQTLRLSDFSARKTHQFNNYF